MFRITRSLQKSSNRKEEHSRTGEDHRRSRETSGKRIEDHHGETAGETQNGYVSRSSTLQSRESRGRGETADGGKLVKNGGGALMLRGDAAFAAGKAFSEASSMETHEHYERKLKIKKTRGDRDRSRSSIDRKQVKEAISRDTYDTLGSKKGGKGRGLGKDALLRWAQKVTAGYPGVSVKNFTTSWRDGLAFNAILHRYRPDLVNWRDVQDRDSIDRLSNAFNMFEREYGVEKSLRPEEVDVSSPDENKIYNYVSDVHDALPSIDEAGLSTYEQQISNYSERAREFLNWIFRTTDWLQGRIPTTNAEIDRWNLELQRLRSREVPLKERELQKLEEQYAKLEDQYSGTDIWRVEEELTPAALQRSWNRFLNLLEDRERQIREQLGSGAGLDQRGTITNLDREIEETNKILDRILERIEDAETKLGVIPHDESRRTINGIVDDLNALEPRIAGYFETVEDLKSARHPEANDYYRQVFGLHQRRIAYLQRCETQLLTELGGRMDRDAAAKRDAASRLEDERYGQIKNRVFASCEEAIKWVKKMLHQMETMEFVEQVQVLEDMLEKHRLDHRDVMDFRHQVDQCIARQAEVSAEDSAAYCERLSVLEDNYEQLRHLSAGRMLDLDSLLAFVRAANQELLWIADRETIEVTRDWSDINRLDIPMLQNYHKQLLHEIELREEMFNAVYNQGSALLGQQHPASNVIEFYLNNMHHQWDWLVALSHCLYSHLQDASNLQQFIEEAKVLEGWIEKQWDTLNTQFDRTEFTSEADGEAQIRDLEQFKESIEKYSDSLQALSERSRQFSPLWQRGERISRSLPVVALCNFADANVTIRKGDECTLLDNSDQVSWLVRTPEGIQTLVPSVVFRIPPPDERIHGYLNRLKSYFDRLKKLWHDKYKQSLFGLIMHIIKTIRGWSPEKFASMSPEERDAWLKKLNDLANRLLSQLDPNDPLAQRLRDELRAINDLFYKLMQDAGKAADREGVEHFDKKAGSLLEKLDEFWKTLQKRINDPLPKDIDALERLVGEHKTFEDALQALDSDVSQIQELFRQLRDPSPIQRSKLDQLMDKWERLWEYSRMYVERLKAVEQVLNGLAECNQIVTEHEITLGSMETLPASLEDLRSLHSQLVELQLVLQQQQTFFQQLAEDSGRMRQHVARTRTHIADHPDVNRIEDEVQRMTVRWENVCNAVYQRLKSVETASHVILVYRPAYDTEIQWLDRIEHTINSLRSPEQLAPDEFQVQLDVLAAEYARLQERTSAIEQVNRDGGRYIREAKGYDLRMQQYRDTLDEIMPGLSSRLRRRIPAPVPGAEIVTKELEALNRRFATLATLLMERQNTIKVLMQNWKRGLDDAERDRIAREARERAEAARRKADEDAERDRLDRLRRQQEADDAERARQAELDRLRRAAEDAERDRLRRAAEDAERDRLRRAAEDAERDRLDRLRRQQEADDAERARQAELDRLRRAAEDAERDRLRKLAEDAERDRLRKLAEDAERDRLRKLAEDAERDRLRKLAEKPPEPQLHIQQGWQMGEGLPGEEVTGWDTSGDLWERARMAEHEDEMSVFEEWTETKTQFYELEAVKHMQTGEILTFVEAIRQGLLDLTAENGEYFDIVSGSKISLADAVARGYISQSLNDCLQTNYGIHDPNSGEDITLLEAIQRGVYDPETRQLRDPASGELLSLMEAVSRKVVVFDNVHKLIKMGILKLPPIQLEDAVEQGVINVETGVFTGKYSKETVPLKDALKNGYISITSNVPPMIAITLSEAIENLYINPFTGEFVDKNSQEKFTLREAVSRAANLINLNVREIVHTADRRRITVSEALVRNVLNTRQNNFTDLLSKQSMPLQDAYDKDYIQRPLTLKEVCKKDLIDSVGRIVDTGTKKRLSALEAIAEGFLDPDTPHIHDPIEGDTISLSDALERGLFDPEGHFLNEDTGEKVTVSDANKRGWLVEPVRTTIFDVKAVRNTKMNMLLSFNEAVDANVIDVSSGRILNVLTNQSFTLPDTAEAGLVDPLLHKILSSPIGIQGRGGSLITVFEAVCQAHIDPKTGVFLDRGQKLTPKEAYNKGLISLKGAMLLTAIFNVHPTLIGAPKAVLKRRKRRPAPGSAASAVDSIKMTIAEALKQGLIDATTQRYRHEGQDITLDEALKQGLIDTKSEWIVPAKGTGASGPVIEEKTTEQVTETSQVLAPKVAKDKSSQETVTTVKRQRMTETTSTGGPGGVSTYKAITAAGKGKMEVPVSGMHIQEAEKQGLLDMTNGLLTVPGVDRVLNLDEALELGIISSSSIQVKDPRSGTRHPIGQAMERGFMTPNGQFLDAKDTKIAFRDAVAMGFIEVQPAQPSAPGAPQKTIYFGGGPGPVFSFTPKGTASLEESQEGYLFDASRGEVTDSLSHDVMSIDDAIRLGKIPKDSVSIKDALTDRSHSYDDALRWGIIDEHTRQYHDKKYNRRMTLKEASKLGFVNIASPLPASSRHAAADAIQTAVKIQTRKLVSTKEAAIAGPTAFVNYSLQHIIDLGWFNQESGYFTHPDTGKKMTLKDAITKGLFNPYETTVVDPSTNEILPLLDAVQIGILEANTGHLVNKQTGEKLNLKQAVERKLIRSGIAPQSLDAALKSGRVNIETAEIENPDGSGTLKLHEAIQRNIISADSITVKDPSTGSSMSLADAVNRKIVDLDRGLVLNQRTGEATSFLQAISSGILHPVPSKYSSFLPPAPTTSLIAQPAATVVGREELVDIGGGKQAMVRVVRAPDGSEVGEYLDPSTGMKLQVKLHGDPYVTQAKTTVKSTSQVQAIELEPHAEVVGIDRIRDQRSGRVMSLADAQRAGLAKVDKKGKQLTKSYAVFRSDINHALNEGVVDAASGHHLALRDAIHAKVIDIHNLKYQNPVSGESLDLVRAANMGLIDVTLAELLPRGVCNPANGERISTQKAIDIGIIDPRSGRVMNPFTHEELTWLDVLKPVYASMTMEGVYDPRKGYAVPVTSALNDGIIDPQRLTYSNPITHETLSLEEASKKGLIDEDTYKVVTKPSINDWRSYRQVSLLEAVQSKLVDSHNRTVELERGVVLPIARAVQEGKFPADVGSKMRRVDKLTFAEALGKGLIDVHTNQFTDPDTGRKLTVAQALEQGYIDTGSVESLEGRDEKNLANVIQSDEFDENSGRIREQKTGLYLTFREAMVRGYIDEDSLIYDTESGRTITLKEAVDQGKIDSNGKYVDAKTGARLKLKEAVRVGLIAIIASPMMANQAVAEAVKRRDAEGYRFKVETVGGSRSRDGSPIRGGPGSGPTVIEETTIRYTPRKVEPSLSLRIRTDESGDRARSYIDDPSAIADRQFEFLDNLQTRGFDVDQKVVENPSTGKQLSIREAIENGLLDVTTGEIVNLTSGRRYSIPKSVHLKLLQPEAAEHIMSALNLSIEELQNILQGLSPARPRSSDWSPASFGSRESLHHTPTGDAARWTTVKDIRWRTSAGPDGEYKYTERNF